MQIRKATIEDIISIVNIEKNVFNETLGESFLYDELSINPFSRMYVIEKEHQVIAFLGLRVDELAEVMNFAVQPSFQHQGYGSMLLSHALEELKKEHVKTLSLEVRESNIKAQKFYQKFGFHISHKRKAYYQNEDAIVYVKEVDK
ncbi:MAG: ribosomal protein S18-alanine N-acetyltransferase [Acholeplasmataceae bacterium]|jgi:ribosomal-protein-alanine N-acetyltransferase|nr:ribosomal protein S18-alanine N-acetyltransferase [Acholeplasmataceae bacterium]